jgi:Rne/Rng family ribonuclease
MSKEMVISANPHETRVAILEEGQLCEYYVEREREFALVGSIYKGRVTRVLPGMQSAFVDIGLDSDAFLYVTDFLEGIEEFEPIVATVEGKSQKMQDQGGQVFPAGGDTAPIIAPPDVESAPAPESESAALAQEASTLESAPITPLAAPSSSHSSPAPHRDSGSQDRGRFEGRQRHGRDFGRRGRGGRFGRRGGRGGDRRYGRELPQSKYAAPRSYDDRQGDAPSSESYVPVILPGESLARYKDRGPSAATGAAPAHEHSPAIEQAGEPHATVESSAPAAPVEPPVAAERPASFRSEFSAPARSGLEPLPGETLSKFHREETAAEAVIESAAPEASPELSPEIDQPAETIAAPEEHVPDLSEEEATTLAAHVAEAKSEVAAAAREAQAELGAQGEVTEADEADLAEIEEEMEEEDEAMAAEHAAEEEEQEIEAEEAEAENEGMVAPPVDFEHEHEFAAEPDAVAAEAGLAIDSDPVPPQEQQPSTARVRDDFRARMQHPARRGGRDRGRRPHHRHGHGHYRSQPRRPQLIADLLKQGQEIIVQIAKEPLGKKGARITSHIALPGRYLVYMPTLDHSGVSRKIASAEERSRLRHLVNEAKGSAGGGFIVRTAAASAAPEEVRADVEFLTHTWNEIKTRNEQRKAPSLLHRDLNLVERILRDHMSADYTAVWVDSEDTFTKVVDFMSRFQPKLADRVKLYTRETPVFEEFGIQQEIDKSLRPKVWLKSGGYIVINHTEALVAIDVNTGKFVGKGSTRLEDTIVRTNLEAVKEIVRQMRLRDLGGIIVIDFIDMEDRRNREKVMAALEDALRADRAPSKMLRFNEFGLIAITRKRTKQALERTLCQPCPYCTGSGMVKSIPTLCYEIQTEARKMAPEITSGSLTLRVHPEIAKAFKTRESSLVEELENWTKKSVIIQADPTLHWEQYDIY